MTGGSSITAPWTFKQFWYIIFGLIILLATYGTFLALPNHVYVDMPVEGNTAPQGQYWYEDEPDFYEKGEVLEVRWESTSSVLIGMAKMEDARSAAGNLSKLKLVVSDEGAKGSFTFTAPEDGEYPIIVANAVGSPTGMIYMDRYDRILTVGHVCGMMLGVIMMIAGAILLFRAMIRAKNPQQAAGGSPGQYGPVQAQQQPQYPVCPTCNVYLDQYDTCPQCGWRGQ